MTSGCARPLIWYPLGALCQRDSALNEPQRRGAPTDGSRKTYLSAVGGRRKSVRGSRVSRAPAIHAAWRHGAVAPRCRSAASTGASPSAWRPDIRLFAPDDRAHGTDGCLVWSESRRLSARSSHFHPFCPISTAADWGPFGHAFAAIWREHGNSSPICQTCDVHCKGVYTASPARPVPRSPTRRGRVWLRFAAGTQLWQGLHSRDRLKGEVRQSSTVARQRRSSAHHLKFVC